MRCWEERCAWKSVGNLCVRVSRGLGMKLCFWCFTCDLLSFWSNQSPPPLVSTLPQSTIHSNLAYTASLLFSPFRHFTSHWLFFMATHKPGETCLLAMFTGCDLGQLLQPETGVKSHSRQQLELFCTSHSHCISVLHFLPSHQEATQTDKRL